MCRDKRSKDNTPSDNLSFLDYEDDDSVEENNSSVVHKIQRSVLVAHIKSLPVGPINEAFITPIMALKVVDFIHLLNHRTVSSSQKHDANLTVFDLTRSINALRQQRVKKAHDKHPMSNDEIDSILAEFISCNDQYLRQQARVVVHFLKTLAEHMNEPLIVDLG